MVDEHTPEPALFERLHRMMLADSDDRRIDLLSCILLRRLEASRMTRD